MTPPPHPVLSERQIIGCLKSCKLRAVNTPSANDRFIAFHAIRTGSRPTTTHAPTQAVRSEIEKFFVATDELESKELKFLWLEGGRRPGNG